MRLSGATALCTMLLAASAGAQEAAGDSAATRLAPSHPDWSFYASVYAYFIPEDSDYLQPTLIADQGWLHLEARYNYEDLETVSMWGGCNFSVGERVALEITPMLGGVFGNTTGIAPGYRGSLDWWRLELYSEGEYVRDIQERQESFFYSWTELTLSPLEWLRAGLVAQRVRVDGSEFEIQRGFLVGSTFRQIGITGHVFDPDESQPSYVASIGVEF